MDNHDADSRSSTAAQGRLRLSGDKSVETQPTALAARDRDVAFRPDDVRAYALDDRFVDEGEVARGGMASVHRVLERSLYRTVAMKLLPKNIATLPRYRHRFIAEAQVTGQLEHPNIVSVYELGADDEGVLFFTMPLIEGQNFSEWLRAREPLDVQTVEAAVEIFFKVCDALSYAHSRGVVHRDVKPSNIMVGDHGQVYLMDWGIARVQSQQRLLDEFSDEDDDETTNTTSRRTTTLTAVPIEEQGQVLGTYAYMASEQARGDQAKIDERTDVFALGAVLFRIVTGRAPFEGPTAIDALARAVACKLPDLSTKRYDTLRRALLDVAYSALKHDPEERFQNVGALRTAVGQVMRGAIRFPATYYNEGDIIIDAGSEGSDAFYIRSGECEVVLRQDGAPKVIKTLGPGEVFGETAVFTGKPRNATVRAKTKVQALRVPGTYLADAVGLDSWLGAFVRALGNRFSERNERVASLEHQVVVAHAALFMERTRSGGAAARLDALLAAVCASSGASNEQVRAALAASGYRTTSSGHVEGPEGGSTP